MSFFQLNDYLTIILNINLDQNSKGMEDIEQVCQALVGLFEKLISPSGIDKEANSQLVEFSKNPNIAFPCFAIIESTASDSIKVQAYLMLSNTFKKFQEDSEQRNEVFGKAISLIAAAPNDICRYSIIDKICDICCNINNEKEMEGFLHQLAEVSLQLIENEATLNSTFKIWSRIIYIPSIVEAYNQFIHETLIPIALGAFHSENIETRIQNYKFIRHAVQVFMDDEEAMSEEVKAKIIEEMSGAVSVVAETVQNVNEATALSASIYEIINFGGIVDEFLPLFEPIIGYIANSEIDLSVRTQLFLPLIELVKFCGIDLAENLPEYIPSVIQFVVELASTSPEEGQYKITEDFFKYATMAIEDAGLEDDGAPVTAITIYYPLLEELLSSQEPPQYLAVFLIFTGILYASSSTLIELYDDVETMIVDSITSGNEPLVDSALYLIFNIVSEAQTIAPHIQTKFEPIIQQLISENEVNGITNFALQTLNRIYTQSETEPENPLETIQFLLGLFEAADSYRHELAFSCISEIICNMNDIPDTVYPAVKPIIEELISSGAARIALDGIPAFAEKVPAAIAEDLEAFITTAQEALSSDDCFLVSSASTASLSLFECFCTTLEAQIPAFFELAINAAKKIYSVKEDDDIPEEEEEGAEMDDDDAEERYNQLMDNKRAACGNALILAARLFSLAPEALKETAGDLVELQVSFLEIDTPTTIITCSKAVPDIITGLVAIGEDPVRPFSTILEDYPSIEDENTLIELWNSISFSYRSLPVEVAGSLTPEICEILCGIFDGRYAAYTKGAKEGAPIRSEFIPPILTMIEEALLKLNEGFEQFIPEIAPRIIKIFEERNPVNRSLALSTTSMIISFFPALTDLVPPAIEELKKDIENTYQAVKQSVYMAIHFLTLANKEYVQEFAEAIIADCIKTIKEEDSSSTIKSNAALLWGTLIQAFEVTPSQEDLVTILESIPGPAHNYILKSNAIFIDYAIKRWPEVVSQYALTTAVTVLGSDDILFSYIPPEIAVTLAQIISSAEEGLPESTANNNELQISYFRKHMAQLSQ